MQRDDWYTSARSPRDLADPVAVGDYAGRRALARLRARRIGTQTARVLFEAPVANGLLGSFVAAVSGGSLYRKSSFLLDTPRAAGVLAHRERARGPVRAARLRQRLVRRRRRRDDGARRGARRRAAGLLPRHLLGAQARHAEHRQRGRQPQPRAGARRQGPRRHAARARHGTLRHRADGTGRQHGDRRLLARRLGLLGRGRARSSTRWRRSPSPATSARCSATSPRSATTWSSAARAPAVRSWSTVCGSRGNSR